MSYLEGFMETHEKPKKQRQPRAKTHKKIKGNKKKKSQNNRRGTKSKVNCYQPSDEEVDALQSFSLIYKKAAATLGHDEALAAVQDAECMVLDYSNVPLVMDGPLVSQLGLDKVKAAGGLNHECYQKQKGKNADLLLSDYTKKNTASTPKPAPVTAQPYDVNAIPMSLSTNPPPYPKATTTNASPLVIPPAPAAPGTDASSTTTANAYGASPAPVTSNAYGAPTTSNAYGAPAPTTAKFREQLQQRREQNSLNPKL